MERREFVRKWSRLALLGGMAATAGYFAFSGKIKDNSYCDYGNDCNKCLNSKFCQTPKSSRHVGTSSKGDLNSAVKFRPPLGGGGSELDHVNK